MSADLRSFVRSATLFRRQEGALPQTLILFVTSRCNARCAFCLYYEQITNPTAKERELRPDEFDSIAARYGPLHYLALSGGEPFVRDDLDLVCQPFIDRCGTSVVDIPSNFYFGDQMVDTLTALVERNPDVVFDIQLSLDHVGEKHDQSRKVKDLYRIAVDTFARLGTLRSRRPNLKLKISIVYLDSNARDLDRIANTIERDFAADRVQLVYPHVGLPASGSADPAEKDRVERYIAEAERLDSTGPLTADLHTLGIRSVKPVVHDLLRDAVSGARPTGDYCDVGKLLVVVDEKGDVFPCEPLWKSIGNLREHGYDMGSILRGAAYHDFREQYLGGGKCSCTWSCAMNTYVSVSPRFFPRMALEASRIVARRVGERLG